MSQKYVTGTFPGQCLLLGQMHKSCRKLGDDGDAEILDADGAANGHQIHVVGGGITVKVEVRSQDQVASHAYTVVVTLDDIVSRYDSDGNGVIDREEVLDAVEDYFDGLITREEVLDVIESFFAG